MCASSGGGCASHASPFKILSICHHPPEVKTKAQRGKPHAQSHGKALGRRLWPVRIQSACPFHIPKLASLEIKSHKLTEGSGVRENQHGGGGCKEMVLEVPCMPHPARVGHSGRAPGLEDVSNPRSCFAHLGETLRAHKGKSEQKAPFTTESKGSFPRI